MSNDNKGEMIQISGLWLNESKGGEKYFTGYMGNAKILIFKNKFKEADNQPDYILYVAPKPKPEDQDSQDTTPSSRIPF